MEPIYKSPLISFVNAETNEPIAHPIGDYSALNNKLQRVEYIVNKYQPNEPIIVLYKPPKELNNQSNEPIVALSSQKNKMLGINTLEQIFTMNNINSSPDHTFVIPAIGRSPSVTSFSKIANFNEFNTHMERLDDIVNAIISRLEIEYDAHPLHYNNQVEFRDAKYIDNRQAFSFWPVEKPFGEYPLTKPLFDKAIEQLNAINKNYHIAIDFVTDWENMYSSFDSPPKSYAIEVVVWVDDKQLTCMRTAVTAAQLELCKSNHDVLDQVLSPMFDDLIANTPNWYTALNTSKKLKI